MRSEKKQISIDTIKFFAGTFSSMVMSTCQNFFLARVFGPASFGVWNLLMVFLGYTQNAHVGLIFGMTKQVPILRGEGNHKQIENIQNNVFTAICIIELILFFIISIVVFFKIGSFSKEIYSGLIIVSIIMVITQFYVYFFSILRNDLKFGLLSFASFLLPLLSFGSIFVCNAFFGPGINVFLSAVLFSNLIVVAIVVLSGKLYFSLAISKKVIKKLFIIGFPLLISAFGFTFFLTVDRWVIGKMLDAKSLGYYSLGSMFVGLLYTIPSVFSSTLFPRMLYYYGKNKKADSAIHLIYKPMIILAIIMMIIIGVVALIIPYLINYILPSYRPGMLVIVILLFGSYFFSFSSIISTYLISVNYQNTLLKIQYFHIFLLLICDYLVIKSGAGLLGVAICSSLIYFLYGLIILFKGLKVLFSDNIKSVTIILKILLLYFFGAFCYFLLSKYLFFSGHLLFFDSIMLILKIIIFIIFIILCIPLIYGLRNTITEVRYILKF